jgi:hypothetical protein
MRRLVTLMNKVRGRYPAEPIPGTPEYYRTIPIRGHRRIQAGSSWIHRSYRIEPVPSGWLLVYRRNDQLGFGYYRTGGLWKAKRDGNEYLATGLAKMTRRRLWCL